MQEAYVTAGAAVRCSCTSPRCAATHAERRGCSTMRTSAAAMNAGTIALKADSGSTSSSTPPVVPPSTAAVPRRRARLRWPASSRRYPMAPATDPGTSPIVFDTFATSGENPTASSTGKVISVPLPTTVLMVPAATPARTTATTSNALTTWSLGARAGGLERLLGHDVDDDVAQPAVGLGEPLAAQLLPHHGAALAALPGLAALALALDAIAGLGHSRRRDYHALRVA